MCRTLRLSVHEGTNELRAAAVHFQCMTGETGCIRRIGRMRNGTLQQGWFYQSPLAIAVEVDASGAVTRTFEYASHESPGSDAGEWRAVSDHH